MKRFKEYITEAKGGWSAIFNAYGDWKRVDGFSSKRDAVAHVQMDIGVGTKAKKVGPSQYEIDGTHLITKSKEADLMGFEE